MVCKISAMPWSTHGWLSLLRMALPVLSRKPSKWRSMQCRDSKICHMRCKGTAKLTLVESLSFQHRYMPWAAEEFIAGDVSLGFNMAVQLLTQWGIHNDLPDEWRVSQLGDSWGGELYFVWEAELNGMYSKWYDIQCRMDLGSKIWQCGVTIPSNIQSTTIFLESKQWYLLEVVSYSKVQNRHFYYSNKEISPSLLEDSQLFR